MTTTDIVQLHIVKYENGACVKRDFIAQTTTNDVSSKTAYDDWIRGCKSRHAVQDGESYEVVYGDNPHLFVVVGYEGETPILAERGEG